MQNFNAAIKLLPPMANHITTFTTESYQCENIDQNPRQLTQIFRYDFRLAGSTDSWQSIRCHARKHMLTHCGLVNLEPGLHLLTKLNFICSVPSYHLTQYWYISSNSYQNRMISFNEMHLKIHFAKSWSPFWAGKTWIPEWEYKIE